MSTKKNILAVIVPGIGYHVEKPLLYYARKMISTMNAEIVCVSYSELPQNIMNNEGKKKEAFQIAMEDVKKCLQAVSIEEYQSIVFVSKSIGTVVSLAIQKELGIDAVNVLYTPLAQTFAFPVKHAISFRGTNDPWADFEELTNLAHKHCEEDASYLEANHSLETGEVLTDLANMQDIMHKTYAFLKKHGI